MSTCLHWENWETLRISETRLVTEEAAPHSLLSLLPTDSQPIVYVHAKLVRRNLKREHPFVFLFLVFFACFDLEKKVRNLSFCLVFLLF